MRIAVMGTGGVGGYFGARLAGRRPRRQPSSRGHGSSTPCGGRPARGEPAGRRAPARCRAPPTIRRDLGAVDVVLFGVKLWDTEAAAELVKPLLGRAAPPWCRSRTAWSRTTCCAAALGAEHVLGGVCYIAATIAEPGVIRHTGTMQKLVFGEYDGTTSPRVAAFRDACARSGIDVEISDDDRAHDLGEVRLPRRAVRHDQPGPRDRSARSATTRARAPSCTTSCTRWCRSRAPRAWRCPPTTPRTGCASSTRCPPTMTSSMHHDLERGNRLEVAWLSGDVVARGAAAGVATPANRAVADLLAVHADGAR